MTTPTHQEAVKVLRNALEISQKVLESLGLCKNSREFAMENNMRALAATSQVEAATSEAARTIEILRTERDIERAKYDHAMKVLLGIFALLPPNDVELGGQVFRFNDPNANETLRGLKARIYAIADEVKAAAPLALPATEQEKDELLTIRAMADCMSMVRGDLIEMGIIDKSVPPMFIPEAVAAYCQAAQAKPDLSGLTRFGWAEAYAGDTSELLEDANGTYVLYADVAALLAHPVAQAKPERGAS